MLWATDEYAVNDDDERAGIGSRTRYSWLSADTRRRRALSGNLWLGHSRIEIDRVGDVEKPEFASAMCPIIVTPTCGTRAAAELALE